jgi:hypothetical protein
VQKLELRDLQKLLVDETSLVFEQKKWFKKIFRGNIEVVDVAYQLKITSNKRQPQYLTMILPDGKEIHIYTHSRPYNYFYLESGKND